jgi:hypothetical protein
LLSSSPVLISLALSLALTSSGICNPLQKCNLELEARVGIGQSSPIHCQQNIRFPCEVKHY